MDAAGRNSNGRHSALWQLTGRSALDIASHGQRREITFAVDPIRQEPVVAVEVRTAENVKNGTSAKLWWPVSACSKLADATVRFLQLADDYTVLNPHLTLSVGVDVIFPADRFEDVAGLMKPRKRRRMTEAAKRQATDRLRQYQFTEGQSRASAAVQLANRGQICVSGT